MAHHEDFVEDSTMQELHQIRAEFARQQQESGLAILEWLEATEKDLRKSLAEDGFRMVKRGDRIFMYEIKPHSKSNGKYKTYSKTQKKSFEANSIYQIAKPSQHKNYGDYIKDSKAREFSVIREEIEQQDKYKITPKRKKTKSRKK